MSRSVCKLYAEDTGLLVQILILLIGHNRLVRTFRKFSSFVYMLVFASHFHAHITLYSIIETIVHPRFLHEVTRLSYHIT